MFSVFPSVPAVFAMKPRIPLALHVFAHVAIPGRWMQCFGKSAGSACCCMFSRFPPTSTFPHGSVKSPRRCMFLACLQHSGFKKQHSQQAMESQSAACFKWFLERQPFCIIKCTSRRTPIFLVVSCVSVTIQQSKDGKVAKSIKPHCWCMFSSIQSKHAFLGTSAEPCCGCMFPVIPKHCVISGRSPRSTCRCMFLQVLVENAFYVTCSRSLSRCRFPRSRAMWKGSSEVLGPAADPSVAACFRGFRVNAVFALPFNNTVFCGFLLFWDIPRFRSTSPQDAKRLHVSAGFVCLPERALFPR